MNIGRRDCGGGGGTIYYPGQLPHVIKKALPILYILLYSTNFMNQL